MVKKLICAFMAFGIVFCNALAVDAETAPVYEEIDNPRFQQITSMSAGLTISDSGYARCTGTVSLRPGYNVRATVALYEIGSGSWDLVHSWTGTGSGPLGANVSNGWWVVHGTYIVEVTAYVTDSAGNYIESPTVQSYIDTY